MADKNGVMEWWSYGVKGSSPPALQYSRTPALFVMDLTDLHLLCATEAARLIRDGVISSEQLVDDCLPLGSF